MAVIESRDYQETRDALKLNPIMMYLLHRDNQVKWMHSLNEAGLKREGIARRVDGKLLATHSFMLAANRRFHELEEANPEHAFTGPMHLGAVVEVLLESWEATIKSARDVRQAALDKLGILYHMPADPSPDEAREVVIQVMGAVAEARKAGNL